jgi:hypothetical protein
MKKQNPKSVLFVLSLSLLISFVLNMNAQTAETNLKEAKILLSWQGDYPVVQFDLLPDNQREQAVGFISDAKTFEGVWKAFKPGEDVPQIDFKANLVLFARNTHFYNRISIGKVNLKNGIAEVLAMETMSALPIEDKAAMSLAVIPRVGVKFIRVGQSRIPVPDVGETQETSATDPLQASYRIEKQEVRLIDGQAEAEAAPGSATKIKTSVFGQPVFGDLNRDGNEDAALLLVHQPGGSGTFYYVAAALNANGGFRGTNAVLLGDRIVPQTIEIRDGVVIANYADRRTEESMSTPPSVGMSKYLVVKAGELVTMQPMGKGN